MQQVLGIGCRNGLGPSAVLTVDFVPVCVCVCVCVVRGEGGERRGWMGVGFKP